jgi:nicotinamidase-related amidase
VNVVNLRTYSDPGLMPVIVVVDPQLEYQAVDRALRIPDADRAIGNCRRIMAFARANGLPVALTRWRQRGKFLADVDGFGGWLKGFEPRGSDMVFEKSLPSCYSSQSFSEMMDQGGGDHAVIIGFTGALACLSTIVDGYHRGHKLTFISDASASHPLGSCTSEQTDKLVASVIGLYGPVATAEAWMQAQLAALLGHGRYSNG